MKPISCNTRNGEHQKAFVPQSPTGSSLVLGMREGRREEGKRREYSSMTVIN